MRIIIQIFISSFVICTNLLGQDIRLVVHGISDVVHKLEIRGTTSDNYHTLYLGNHTSSVQLKVNGMDLFKMTTFDNFGNIINTEEVWLDGDKVDMRPTSVTSGIQWAYEGSPVNKTITHYKKRVKNRDFTDLNMLYQYFYSLVSDHKNDMVASVFVKPVLGLFGEDKDKLYRIYQLIKDQSTDVRQSMFMQDIHTRLETIQITPESYTPTTYNKRLQQITHTRAAQSKQRINTVEKIEVVSKKEKPKITIDLNRFAVVNRNGLTDRVVVDSGSPAEVVIMDFWFTQCRPCAKDHKEMKEDKKEGGFLENVDIVGISVDKHVADWQFYLNKNEIPWTNYKEDLSSDHAYSRKIGIWTYPNYLVLDKTGKVLAQVNSYYKVKEVLASL